MCAGLSMSCYKILKGDARILTQDRVMTRRGYVKILLIHFLTVKDSCNAKQTHKYIHVLKLQKFYAGKSMMRRIRGMNLYK